jgi:hypothetical protein
MNDQVGVKLPPPVSEFTTIVCLLGSWGLIVLAISAPFISAHFGDSLSDMFQRGGAVTTIAAMLTAFLEKWALTRHYSGMGVIKPEEVAAYAKYQRLFKPISAASFCLSIIGTVIWGYGDLLVDYAIDYLNA